MMLPKETKARDRDFLRWAKDQGGLCCVCRRMWRRETPANHLHHHGARGMGQKGSDYIVARVCGDCHAKVQGKTRIWASKVNHAAAWELIAAMQEDTIALLEAYLAE